MAVIGEAPPAQTVASVRNGLAQGTAIKARRCDAGIVRDLQHGARQHVGAHAHHCPHPGGEIDDIALDACCRGNMPIGFLERKHVAAEMRLRPIPRIRQMLHAIARADHAERTEQQRLGGVGERLVCGLAQYLARRIERDILIGVARAGFALQRRGGQARAQHAGILPLLQLVVIGVSGEAGALGQKVGDRYLCLRAARQAQRRVPIGDRTVEIDRAALGQRRRQHARRGFGYRGPSKQRLRGHRGAGRSIGDAIGTDEAELAVLNHRHREPGHLGPLRERRELLVERAIVDSTPPFGGRVGKLFGLLDRDGDAGERMIPARGAKTEPARQPQRDDRDKSNDDPGSEFLIGWRPHMRPSS